MRGFRKQPYTTSGRGHKCVPEESEQDQGWIPVEHLFVANHYFMVLRIGNFLEKYLQTIHTEDASNQVFLLRSHTHLHDEAATDFDYFEISIRQTLS